MTVLIAYHNTWRPVALSMRNEAPSLLLSAVAVSANWVD
jgi:hypothetical protein